MVVIQGKVYLQEHELELGKYYLVYVINHTKQPLTTTLVNYIHPVSHHPTQGTTVEKVSVRNGALCVTSVEFHLATTPDDSRFVFLEGGKEMFVMARL